ncbi:MAG: penicillin-binding transpeptidase domain-containing protein, partial [Rikenellaceae bacterium]
MNLLYFIFIVASVSILTRIVWVQVFSQEVSYNSQRLKGRIFSHQDIKAHRGSILTRDGEALATSIFKYQAMMDFGCEGFDSLERYKFHYDSLSKLLSSYFGDKPPAQYRKFFYNERQKRYKLVDKGVVPVYRSSGRFWRWVDSLRGELYVDKRVYDTIRDHTPVALFPREIEYSEWQALRRYPILNWSLGMSYNLTKRDERIYPQGELAGRIIGKITGDKGVNYGIERVHSEHLAGRDGKVLRQRIARGFSGRVVGGEVVEAKDGDDVVTTLDLELMDVADKALRSALNEHNALWGTTIVMEVESGDILAMVNLSQLKNGSYSEYVDNYAIKARMEPGSTFKLAATLALLDDAKMSEEQIYNSGNGETVLVGRSRVKVRDSHAGFTEVNLRTAFTQSLNGYFAQAVYEHYKDNAAAYTSYLQQLNIDKRVGFEDYGEPRPLFPSPDNKRLWTPHSTLVFMGYGYGVELTPIQTITLYNAVANGGKMVAPRLIKEIRRGDKVLERFDERVISKRISSPEAIAKAQSLLEDVAMEGTASRYLSKFKGMRVGAKTGTAQFAQNGISYADGYYLGSMVGYMPSEKPRYTVMTAIFTRRGRGKTIYGAGLTGQVERD